MKYFTTHFIAKMYTGYNNIQYKKRLINLESVKCLCIAVSSSCKYTVSNSMMQWDKNYEWAGDVHILLISPITDETLYLHRLTSFWEYYLNYAKRPKDTPILHKKLADRQYSQEKALTKRLPVVPITKQIQSCFQNFLTFGSKKKPSHHDL